MCLGHVIKNKPPECLVYAPAIELRYVDEMAELDHVKIATTYLSMQEMKLMLINTGIGDGTKNTSELKVHNSKKAMGSPDTNEWQKEIKNKKARFDKYHALMHVPSFLWKVPKVLTTTRAMKKKSNGTYRGRINEKGYEQVGGSHYSLDSIAAPVTNPITVCITMLGMSATCRRDMSL
jgi:hypothetical protein